MRIFALNFRRLLSMYNLQYLHVIVHFCKKNMPGIDKIKQFHQDTRLLALSSPVVCGWLWKQETSGLLLMRWGCRLRDGQSYYCRCSRWPPLTVTHAVKRSVKFATALLMTPCSCGSSSQVVYRATFNSFGFGWSLWYYEAVPGASNKLGDFFEWVIEYAIFLHASSMD